MELRERFLLPGCLSAFKDRGALGGNSRSYTKLWLKLPDQQRIKKLCYCFKKKKIWGTHDEHQPIRGFSQRSRLSNSILQAWVLLVPDCIALRAGTKIRTRRVLMCSSGTPVSGAMSI